MTYGLEFFQTALEALADSKIDDIERMATAAMLSRHKSEDVREAVSKMRNVHEEGASRIARDQEEFIEMFGA